MADYKIVRLEHVTARGLHLAQGGAPDRGHDETPLWVRIPEKYEPAEVTAADVAEDPAITVVGEGSLVLMWDTHDAGNEGWSYRLYDARGAESGPIDSVEDLDRVLAMAPHAEVECYSDWSREEPDITPEDVRKAVEVAS